jgi:ribosomal protein S18 acetylase RimI-like enzyme
VKRVADDALLAFAVTLDVTVRLATAADLLHLETWRGFDTPAHRRALRYYLAATDAEAGAFLVADVAGYPVGQLFLWYHRDDPALADGATTVSITALRVWQPFRRRGIAARLNQVAERLARQRGFQVVTIGADVDNHAAQRLYLAWGYEEFMRSTYEWDGRTYPQVCLRKRL